MNPEKLTIDDIQSALKDKETTSVKLTEEYLKLIREKDKDIKSLLEVTDELALSQAKKVDNEKDFKDLTGVPIVIKDNILVEDERATGGSKILEHFRASHDATVIKKIKEAGAIIVGKGNMDEFAMGGSTENSAFFPTKNPVDTDKVPGGSSGGPAAAVAAGMAPIALGSDTGGSVRQPASFCGIVGFKPSYGRVSRYGVMAMASSLDQVGTFSKTVKDTATLFNVIKGKDEKDATSIEIEEKKEEGGSKIGIPKEYFVDGVDEEVKKTVREAIEKIEKEGFETVEISLPHTEYALACYQLVMASEVSANMARYDGIRYGLETDRPEAKSIEEAYIKNRGKLGEEVKRRVMLGTFALSSGYYDAYYMQAEKVRSLIRSDFEKAFEDLDLVLTPTSPILPFNLGEKVDDPLSIYLADMFTVTANLAELPAISIPCKTKGLPVGLQLIGDKFEDEKLLDLAEKIEKII